MVYRHPRKDFKRVNRKPNWEVVKVLANHGKPLTLLGVSPKTILSDAEWSLMVKSAYRRADKHCEACGSFSEDLRLYDNYKVDYKRQEYKFDDLCVLCPDCWFYIHPFLVTNLVERDRIISRGDALLMPTGFQKVVEFDVRTVYFLSYKGYRYINDYFPSVAQRALQRGLRVIHYEKVERCLAFDNYYHKPLG